MLIIAIGHGTFSDPFTCSDDTECVFENPKDALSFICGQKKIDEEYVDEILIVKDDQVVKHYTSEHWTDFPDVEAEEDA